MANSKDHLVVGVGVSAVVYVGFCHFTGRKVMVGGGLVAGLAGAAMASVPDILEPTVHPNYRGFFHSVAALSLSAYMGLSPLGDPESSEEYRLFALLVSSAFISHLILDGLTTKSLPTI